MARTEATRTPERMSHDRAALDALLDDSAVLAHIAFVDEDGTPAIIPTSVARWGDSVLAHGSTGSHWMRRIATGVPVAVSIGVIDGIVVARSAFESSLVYTSAVLFGSFTPIDDHKKEQALDVLTERLLPGRVNEVRRPNARELAATLMVRMPIEEWSLRSSDHWPDDPEDDIAGDAWAGILRFGTPPITLDAAPDLRAGIAVPPSTAAVRGVR